SAVVDERSTRVGVLACQHRRAAAHLLDIAGAAYDIVVDVAVGAVELDEAVVDDVVQDISLCPVARQRPSLVADAQDAGRVHGYTAAQHVVDDKNTALDGGIAREARRIAVEHRETIVVIYGSFADEARLEAVIVDRCADVLEVDRAIALTKPNEGGIERPRRTGGYVGWTERKSRKIAGHVRTDAIILSHGTHGADVQDASRAGLIGDRQHAVAAIDTNGTAVVYDEDTHGPF